MFYFGLQTTSFLGAGSENSIVLGRFLETQVALREHVQHQLVDYTQLGLRQPILIFIWIFSTFVSIVMIAANSGHLTSFQPLGFQVDDTKLKRAGLDYWPYLRLYFYMQIYCIDFLQNNFLMLHQYIHSRLFKNITHDARTKDTNTSFIVFIFNLSRVLEKYAAYSVLSFNFSQFL